MVIILLLLIGGYFLFFQEEETNTNAVVITNQNTNAAVNTNTATNVNSTANANIDTSDWLTYTNEKWGISCKYPSNVNVIENIDKGYVEFRGPEQKPNGGFWPRYFITHGDNDFYNPPADTDVSSWVTIPESDTIKIGSPYMIANHETVHQVSLKTPQSNGTDYYFVINGTKLFMIQVRHDLYDQNQPLDFAFLESIRFNN